MDARRGRRLAVAGAVGVLLVLAASGLAARTWILERYYFHRLAAGDGAAQDEAIAGLSEIGASSGAPAILAHMRRHTEGCKPAPCWEKSVRALGRIRTPEMAPLIQALDDEDPFVAIAACMALARIGPAAGMAVPALERQLREQSTNRSIAALALGTIGPAPSVLPLLLQTLRKDEDESVRSCAVQGILQLGPAGEAALLEAIRDGGGASSGASIIETLESTRQSEESRDEEWMGIKLKKLPPAILEAMKARRNA